MQKVTTRLALALLLGTAAHPSSAGLGDIFGAIADGANSAVSGVKGMVGMSDLTDDLEGTLLDKLAAEPDRLQAKPERAEGTSREQGYQQDLVLVRRGGKSPLQVEHLEDYANRVLQKVLAEWPGKVEARVQLTSSPDFEAHTYQNGTIVLSMGTLTTLESEDQLAALLGHEVSHLILSHHDKDTIAGLTESIAKYGDFALRLNQNSGGKNLGRYARLKAADWLVNGAFLPKWNRGQENEADILGTDLMVRARYNRDAMASVIQIIGVTAQDKQAVVDQQLTPSTGQAAGNPMPQLNLGDILSAVEAGLSEEFGNDYETAQERQKQVREYTRKNYAQTPRVALLKSAYEKQLGHPGHRAMVQGYQALYTVDRALTAGSQSEDKALAGARKAFRSVHKYDPYGRMLMYRIRQGQHKPELATKNLELALKSGKAPYGHYELLLDDSMSRADGKRATAYIEQIEQTFGQVESLLPQKIALRAAQGQATTDLELACTTTGNASLVQRCQQSKASRGRNLYGASNSAVAKARSGKDPTRGLPPTAAGTPAMRMPQMPATATPSAPNPFSGLQQFFTPSPQARPMAE